MTKEGRRSSGAPSGKPKVTTKRRRARDPKGHQFHEKNFDIPEKDFSSDEEENPPKFSDNLKRQMDHFSHPSFADRKFEAMFAKDIKDLGIKIQVRRLNPTLRLSNVRRFRVGPQDEGKLFKLRMIHPSPLNCFYKKPTFELAELHGTYETMQQQMFDLYCRTLSNKPIIDYKDVCRGLYAVIPVHTQDGASLRRIKVLASPQKTKRRMRQVIQGIRVKYIDSTGITSIDCTTPLWYLDKAFDMRPRETAIEMDGMDHYKGSELFDRFVNPTSDEFILRGELTAEVQPNGKVVIWSEDFPQDKYPYGINGFIAQSILEMVPVCKLPRVGEIKQGYYVVYADDEGNIAVQMKSMGSSHFQEVFGSIDVEKIESRKGTVTLAYPKLMEEVFFAPHNTGAFYRAVVVSQSEEKEGSVRVTFIDYGDADDVNVSDLVLASDVHFLMKMFPPMSVRARLDNIWSLNSQRYLNKYHANDAEFSIAVVEGPTEISAAAVLVYDARHRCINQLLVQRNIAEAVDPFHHYTFRTGKSTPRLDNFNYLPKLYIGLGAGGRLKAGDQLEVVLSYRKNMRESFFIVPKDRIQKREDMEEDITSFASALNDINDNANSTFLQMAYPGAFVLCFSTKLSRYVRGVLMSNNEADIRPSVRLGDEPYFEEIVWRVYLIDHGFSERIPLLSIFFPRPTDTNVPAIGIRVKHPNLTSSDALENWWYALKKLKQTTATVKIESIRRDRYGEKAVISWVQVALEGEPDSNHPCFSTPPMEPSSLLPIQSENTDNVKRGRKKGTRKMMELQDEKTVLEPTKKTGWIEPQTWLENYMREEMGPIDHNMMKKPDEEAANIGPSLIRTTGNDAHVEVVEVKQEIKKPSVVSPANSSKSVDNPAAEVKPQLKYVPEEDAIAYSSDDELSLSIE